MTLLNALAVVFAVYLALFLVKLPQLWKVVSASTDRIMSDPASPEHLNRKATFVIGLILSFFRLGRTLRIEGWHFFSPYTKQHLNTIRRHQVKK